MSAPPWTPSVYLLTDLTGCWHAQRKWKLWDKTDKVNIFSHTISHVTTKMGNIKWATSSLKICPGSTKNTERMPLKGNPSPGEPRQLLNRLRGRQRPQRAPDNSEGPGRAQEPQPEDTRTHRVLLPPGVPAGVHPGAEARPDIQKLQSLTL